MVNDKPVHDAIMTKVLYVSSLNSDTPLVPCTRMAETTSLVIVTCKRNDFAGDLACCCLRDAISCRQTSTWRARSEPADTLYFCSIGLSHVSYRPECKQVHTQRGNTLACSPANLCVISYPRRKISECKNAIHLTTRSVTKHKKCKKGYYPSVCYTVQFGKWVHGFTDQKNHT